MTWTKSRFAAYGRRHIQGNACPIVIGLLVVLMSTPACIGGAAEQTDSLMARSVILMIGDGMGAEHVKAARWFSVGPSGALAMDQLEVQNGWAHTANAGGFVTDSAASATALATGYKTRNWRLSVDGSDQLLTTILELAKAGGKAVGLVTTVPLTHATPAAFAVHINNRNKSLSIALQLFEAEVDVLMGGGAYDFLPNRVSCDCGWSGQRTDSRDLVSDAQDAGHVFVCDAAGLAGIDVETVERVLGLFGDEEMLQPLSPTLADMTEVAIEILSRDPDGFFLMIEGGQIDWESHDNVATATIDLTLGFDQAVSVALEYIQEVEDALLIVTADHETGGMTVSDEEQGTYREDGPFNMPDGETFYVNWTGGYHTGADVPVRAEGPFAHRLSGTYENTYIFEVMVEALGLLNEEN